MEAYGLNEEARAGDRSTASLSGGQAAQASFAWIVLIAGDALPVEALRLNISEHLAWVVLGHLMSEFDCVGVQHVAASHGLA